MMNEFDFNKFCLEVDPDSISKCEKKVELKGGAITYRNKNNAPFQIEVDVVEAVLAVWMKYNSEIGDKIKKHPKYNKKNLWEYEEKSYRDIFIDTEFFNEADTELAVALSKSQTKGLMFAISKYVGYINADYNCKFGEKLLLDKKSLEKFFDKLAEEEKSKIAPGETKELQDAFDSICLFCNGYQSSSSPYITGSPEVEIVIEPLEVLKAWISEQIGNYRGISCNLKISRGAGKFPRVPWITILPPGQKTNDGIYVAFCFGREGNGAVVGCAQSASKPKEGFKVKKRSNNKALSIDVNGGGPTTRYNDCFENPLEILKGSFDPDAFLSHLRESLDLCFSHLSIFPKLLKEGLLDELTMKLISSFTAKIEGKYLFNRYDIKRFVSALASKPFVILSGNSGTGKTKIAQIFAEWITNQNKNRFALVPVGADWTDNRNVVGFLNLLRKDASGNEGVFQSTPILDLMLSAKDDPDNPYFLILDEMNLSHVERYFSDFLSAMESGKEIPLHSEEGEVFTSGDRLLDNGLSFPPNLFVVGTVNIDETTYMFSPKVLDRANVIEIKVERSALKTFLDNPAGSASGVIESAPEGMAEAFINLSFRSRGISLRGNVLSPLAAPKEIGQVNDLLMKFFDVLSTRGYEFAFRPASEIHRYIRVDSELTSKGQTWDWEEATDFQVLQKLLPKLHGSRRKIEALLVALARLCEDGDQEEAAKFLEQNANLGSYQMGKPKERILLYRSYQKLCKMIETVRRDQFVSFIQ